MRDRVPLGFLGHPLDAEGWRLAGARAVGWSADEAPPPHAAFEALCADCDVVLLDRAAATALPAEALDAALRARHPLVAILPDGGAPLPAEPHERVRRQLGLDP